MVNMNQLHIEKRTQVIAALVEGTSVYAACRMTPAMEVTLTDHLWEIEELIKLLGIDTIRS
jgi:hypothetical protein